MGVYRDLALASSWRGCRWLSLPDPVLFAVATIRELAFLGQLGEALSSVRDPLVPHVTAMYGEVASVLPPGSSRSWRLEVPGLSSQDSETSLSQQLMSLREMRRIIDDAQEGVALGIQVTEARAAWEMFQSTKVWQAPLGEVYKHLKRHLQQPLESRVSG
jgi:hypothetical protein